MFRGLCQNSHVPSVCYICNCAQSATKNHLFLRRPFVSVISFYIHEYDLPERLNLVVAMICLRGWPLLVGSYVINTRVISCPAQRCPESADRLYITPSHLWFISIITWIHFLPLSPPGWRGIVVTVRAGGRPGGRLPNLRNPYLCNRLMDFPHSKFCGIV